MTPQETPKLRKTSLPRKLAWIAGTLFVAVIALYLTVTSSVFLTKVVLPRVGAMLNANITATQVSLSPFSQLTARGLSVSTGTTNTVFAVDELRVRYDLMSILGGTIDASEVSLVAPRIYLVSYADHTTNLDPLLAGSTPETAPPPGKPLILRLQNLAIKNGSISIQIQDPDQSWQQITLTSLEVGVDRVQTGGDPTQITLSTGLDWNGPGAKTTADSLVARMTGAFNVVLDANLLPTAVRGDTRLDVARATGAFAELAGLSGSLGTEWTPSEIKSLNLLFERSGTRLGTISLSGPFDPQTSQGSLSLAVDLPDRQILALAGASAGISLTDGNFRTTNVVELTEGGNAIAVTGGLAGDRLTVSMQTAEAPPLNLRAAYTLKVNLNQQLATVQQLRLDGTTGTEPLVSLLLQEPMSLSWGTSAQAVPDATLQFTLNRLNLDSWRSLLGTNIPTGIASAKATLRTGQNGRQLSAELSAQLEDLGIDIGTNRLTGARFALQSSGTVRDLAEVSLNSIQAEITQGTQSLFKTTGNLQYSLASGDLSLTNQIDAAIASLLKWMPVEGLTLSDGHLQAHSEVRQSGSTQTAVGRINVANLRGTSSGIVLENLKTSIDYAVALDPKQIQIKQFAVDLAHRNSPAGTIRLTGEVQRTNNAARVTFQIADLNQQLLAPVLAQAIAPSRLTSASIQSTGTALYNPGGSSEINASLTVENLVLQEPSKPAPDPIQTQIELTGSMEGQQVDLQKLNLAFTPTARAENKLQVTGRLNMDLLNSTSNQIQLRAQSIDLTSLYNAFAGTETAAPATQPVPPAAPQTIPGPAPTTGLPIKQFTANVQIQKLFLRDIAITNLVVHTGITNNQVTLAPVQLSLNGAPVSATAKLDLGAPEMIYDLMFQADRVPIEPLANSFGASDPGQLQGELITKTRVQGTGFTGASLQKSLAGQVSLSLTNINLQLAGPKTKRILEPIALVLRIPELTQSPINWIALGADLGNGQIAVTRLGALSHALHAEGQGTIQILDVLTNSPIDIPIQIDLRRSLAAKSKLLPPNTPPDAAYVPLPQFAKLTGTLGEPTTEINKLVISGLLLRSAANIPELGNDAGNLLQGLGNLLGGQTSGGTSTNTPAAPDTKTSPTNNQSINPLDFLKRLRKTP
jgi:hypothetical protein